MGEKLQRLNQMFEYLQSKGLVINKKDLSEKMRMRSQASLSRAFSGQERYLTDALLERINTSFGNIFSVEWMKTGNGQMLIGTKDQIVAHVLKTKTIPLDNLGKTEYINVDNIFPNATSAIIYNDDAVNDYPRGSIFILREITGLGKLLPSKLCCITTGDCKIIRIVQQEEDKVVAYATNDVKYPDGSLVYPPLHIAKDDIKSISIVEGVIVKF